LPYIVIDQQKIYYAGDLKRPGIPVIFCHGSGGRHQHWLFQLKGIKDVANPLAVDLPGHGRSSGKPLNTVAAYRDWICRFKETAGIEKFILGGHSLGGAIALAYALQYPDQLLALILAGTGSRLKVLPSFLEALEQGFIPPAFSDYLYGSEASHEMRKSGRKEVLDTKPEQYHADLSACNNFDVMKELHHISCPALIICGSEDQLTPLKYSKYLEENLALSSLRVIRGAGHMVMLEKPEEVNQAISEFIDKYFPEPARQSKLNL
jgi:pimeloyl-ACP methyl ester carboxylesterase